MSSLKCRQFSSLYISLPFLHIRNQLLKYLREMPMVKGTSRILMADRFPANKLLFNGEDEPMRLDE